MTSGRVYLYLARRDRRGVKILAILEGDQRTGRVSDLRTLGLRPEVLAQVEQQVYQDRMLWEPFVEGAPDYATLRQSLYRRGYSNVPVSGQPLVSPVNGVVHPVNTSQIPQRRSMLQRPD